jgi:hypothetical protein
VSFAERSTAPAPPAELPELPQAASAAASNSDNAVSGADFRANLTGVTP